jgi:hypothetical protein
MAPAQCKALRVHTPVLCLVQLAAATTVRLPTYYTWCRSQLPYLNNRVVAVTQFQSSHVHSGAVQGILPSKRLNECIDLCSGCDILSSRDMYLRATNVRNSHYSISREVKSRILAPWLQEASVQAWCEQATCTQPSLSEDRNKAPPSLHCVSGMAIKVAIRGGADN